MSFISSINVGYCFSGVLRYSFTTFSGGYCQVYMDILCSALDSKWRTVHWTLCPEKNRAKKSSRRELPLKWHWAQDLAKVTFHWHWRESFISLWTSMDAFAFCIEKCHLLTMGDIPWYEKKVHMWCQLGFFPIQSCILLVELWKPYADKQGSLVGHSHPWA